MCLDDYELRLQYKNNTLASIATEEGRAVRNTDGTYRYECTLKYHLGNTQVTSRPCGHQRGHCAGGTGE